MEGWVCLTACFRWFNLHELEQETAEYTGLLQLCADEWNIKSTAEVIKAYNAKLYEQRRFFFFHFLPSDGIWYLLLIADSNHSSIMDHSPPSLHPPDPPISALLYAHQPPNYLSPGRWSSGVEMWGWTPLCLAAPSHSGVRASPPRCCLRGTTPASPSRRFYFGAGLWGCSPAPSCYFCWIAVRGKRSVQLNVQIRLIVSGDNTDLIIFQPYCSLSGQSN